MRQTPMSALVRRNEGIEIGEVRKFRGRTPRTSMQVIKTDMSIREVDSVE